MRDMALLLAMAAACGAPTASAGPGGVDPDRDDGHRAHFDPIDMLPLFSGSHGQTYYPHPHWKGRSHRAWRKWIRSGRPGRRPRGARK